VGRHLLLQLSDLHLVPGAHLRRLVDPLANLDRAIDLITSSACRPEGILFTGDLADTGDPVAYRLLRQRIDGLTAAIGAAAVFLPGNHDDRTAFRRHLLATSIDGGLPDEGPRDGTPRDDASPGDPIDQIHFFGDLRVISMDTTIPGDDAGALSSAQLNWLREELATPAPCGTVLALHHPPISSPIDSMTRLALRAPERLRAAIEGTDVCLVVAGHNHHASTAVLAGVPVWVSPALSYRSDTLMSAEYVPLVGSAFTRIDVVDGRPLVTVVPVPPA
jgi:Icc protein